MVSIEQYPLLLNLTPVEQINFYNFNEPYTLQFQLINFYSRLKHVNQMISEGKVTCAIPITWDCLLKSNHGIHYINCHQANVLLKLISIDILYK